MASLLSTFLLLLSASSFSYSFGESRKELRDKEVQEQSLEQLHQYDRIDPRRVFQLSWRPRVFLYSGFLSDEECDHLISLGRNETTSGFVNDSGNTGTNKQFPSLKSQLKVPDYIVAKIEERLSAWTFLPRENGEPLQVMRYGLESADQKFEYFGNVTRPGGSDHWMAVVILYLANVTTGGEILFPDSEAKSKIWSHCPKTANILRPVKGNAILFFTKNLDASPDKRSSHARCPVLEGEMWCAAKFFHVRAVNKRKDLFQSDDNDCTDEDEYCPRWAALGECQRNPVFMIGSPDYYGTCRKSCNEC
ncbi:probable prolyl 4-hydroxylase 12 isoform X2 [Carica papaya]|uniref:probable prolyl 4-hydroxylase 12 isoform X2 n=1 Tax=Carica papaya TaxID=3649 RepID=UPI000B8C8D04|nr:probable prolyl 4-hydroxylase 12 isoform X2 [Carica papaya]